MGTGSGRILFCSIAGTLSMSFIPVITSVLNHLTTRNKETKNTNPRLKVFHSSKVPPVSIADYLDRIVRYSYATPECFINALIYLDRLVTKNPGCYITPNNVHRLLLASCLLAAKTRDDWYYSNSYYGTLGGISNQEVNLLETTFCQLLDFDLYVSPTQFTQYKKELLSHMHAVSPCNKNTTRPKNDEPTPMIEECEAAH